MSSARVAVTGVSGVRRMLRPFLEPELSQMLQKGTKESAKVYAKEVRRTLKPVSKRMASAVRVRTARRDRPASVVGSSRKKAFFWPFVIGGTKQHGPRRAKALAWKRPDGSFVTARSVRGVRGQPLVAEAFERARAQAEAAFTAVVNAGGK